MNNEFYEIIKNEKNIVFFGGAGVSTESNIPDFRSEEGLYQAKKKYKRSPEEMLSASFLHEKPDLFFDYYINNLIHKDAKPNACHHALAKLEKAGKLNAIITQNIDNLHQLAGSKEVYELHGTAYENYCINCGENYNVDYILNSKGKMPTCSKCGNLVRPQVTLYEEALDHTTVNKSIEAISKADVMIVGGTSLVVYPAAGLIEYFRGKYLILVNKTATSYDKKADIIIRDAIGEVFKPILDMKF